MGLAVPHRRGFSQQRRKLRRSAPSGRTQSEAQSRRVRDGLITGNIATEKKSTSSVSAGRPPCIAGGRSGARSVTGGKRSEADHVCLNEFFLQEARISCCVGKNRHLYLG